ncbi:MAG: hypothetical protein ABIQ75_04655 [Flavobacteriales bacterium]
MRIIKAGLKGQKPSQLISKCAHVVSEMTGNANFTTPSPDLATITAARTALEAALEAAESGAHAEIAKKNVGVKSRSELPVKLARYVNSVAGGDVNKAVSSGFDPAKIPQPADKLAAPVKSECNPGAYQGQVDLRCKGVEHARMYQVYMCEGDPATYGTWIAAGTSSKTKLAVKGLKRHQLYSFRAAALGAAGEGPLSEIASAEAA